MGGRPDMGMLVKMMMGMGVGDRKIEKEERGLDVESGSEGEVIFEGRLGVCVSGPASLTREGANAVARFAGTRVGGRVGLHTEVYAV